MEKYTDGIKEINFFTTYQCNSRCRNCFIWREPHEQGDRRILDIQELSNFFESKIVKECPSIGMAGGEPTISRFFWELLEVVPDDKHITITTNALSSKKILAYLEKAKNKEKFMIQLSLDGINGTNDKIRGVPGAYKKTIGMLERLKELGIPRLISFTINRENFSEVEACYQLACDAGAKFSTRIAYCGGAYSNRANKGLYEFRPEELDQLEQSINKIIMQELSNFKYQPAQLVFMKNIVDHYRGRIKEPTCRALETGVVIDLYGDVFPNCPVMMTRIGNIHETSLENILAGNRAKALQLQISRKVCNGCWNDCQVVNNIAADRDFLEKEFSELKMKQISQLEMTPEIDFNTGNYALCMSGWYGIEGSTDFQYSWTDQAFSVVLPKGTQKIHFFAMPFKGIHPENPLKITAKINGSVFGEATITLSQWQQFDMRLLQPVDEAVQCRFDLDQHFCPKAVGDGQDIRKLGIAVQKMDFIQA